jgi:hypothetical protein
MNRRALINSTAPPPVPRGPSGALSVVFDTNEYRGLGDVGIDAMSKAGRARGHVPYVSFYTAIELLSHTADPEDSDYRSARAAIRRLWRHAGHTAWGPAFVPMMHENRVQLCNLLFGAVPQTANATIVHALYELLRHVATAPPDDLLLDIKPRLEAVVGLRQALESIFLDDLVSPLERGGLLRDGRVSLQETQRDEFLAFIASGRGRELLALRWARGAASELGRDLPDDVFMDPYGQAVLASLGTPLVLFEELVRRICIDRLPPGDAKCANWLWDIQQSFQASSVLRLGDRPTLLVTDDGAILRAAAKASNGAHVSSIRRYADGLGVRL